MEEIKRDLLAAVKKVFKAEDEKVVLTVAPEQTGADFASNVAMVLAKKVKQTPLEVAQKLAEELKNDDYMVEIAEPGFLNFTWKEKFWRERAREKGSEAENFINSIKNETYLGKQVVTEFSDPNPFKVLHVGHLYTSIVGEAISRLFEYAGAKVHRANFGGDVGMHVAKTMFAMLKKTNERTEMAKKTLNERAEFMARCYVEGTRAFEEDDTAKEEIAQLNKEIYELVASQKKEGEVAEAYWQAREWSYDYFENFYQQIGVKFEKYYPESMVADKGLEMVKKGLEQGIFEKSDGAVVFKGEKYGLHTRVFINSMGLPTYEAKDVGLTFTKWKDYAFDESVIITGNDITDYMKVILKSVSMLDKRLAERTRHLTHGNVKLPGNMKMSSRKGNFLKAVEVLEKVRELLKETYGEVDEKVALAAVKYAFLKYKMSGEIVFDLEASVSMTGNSGPYLQYAVVRGKKILEKVTMKRDGEEKDGWGVRAEREILLDKNEKVCYNEGLGAFCGEKSKMKKNWKMTEEEKKLVKKTAQYGEVLAGAVAEKAPHKVCAYLYELAQEFSRFYEKVTVAGSEFEYERAMVVLGYVRVMEHGLGILGIEVPEEM